MIFDGMNPDGIISKYQISGIQYARQCEDKSWTVRVREGQIEFDVRVENYYMTWLQACFTQLNGHSIPSEPPVNDLIAWLRKGGCY